MSNEYREDTATQGTVGDEMDQDGPLDPSVFFGLFDDLDEPQESEERHDDDDGGDSDLALSNGSENGHGSADDFDLESAGLLIVEDSETAIIEPNGFRYDEQEADQPAFGEQAEGAVEYDPILDADDEATVVGGLEDLLDEIEPRIEPTSSPAGSPILDLAESDPSMVTSAGAGIAQIASPPPVTSSPPPVVETASDPDGEAAVLEAGDGVAAAEDGGRIQRPEAGGSMAKAALATIAVGLFVGLVLAFIISLRSPDPATNSDTASVTSSSIGTSSESGTDEETTGRALTGIDAAAPASGAEIERMVDEGLATSIANDRVDVTSLQFESGSTMLTSASVEMVAKLGTLLADSGQSPTTVTVRTFSEPTAEANLDLSQRQAEALITELVAAGADPELVRAFGLGSGPLSPAQPVPNFVVVDPGFGDNSLDDTVGAARTFSLGSRTTVHPDLQSPLRLDSLVPLGELGASMSSRPEATIGLAGYSFFESDDDRNRALASASAREVVDFMVDTNQVDPSRISTITPGSAPYVAPASTGNHIWLQAGPASQPAFDVAGLVVDALGFEAGSAQLAITSQPVIDELAAILSTSGSMVVIDVRSYDLGGNAENLTLSEARAEQLGLALVDAGVSPDQLRLHASGASTYFPNTGQSSISLTVVP